MRLGSAIGRLHMVGPTAGTSPSSGLGARQGRRYRLAMAQSLITPEIVAEHGLSPEEYERVLHAMGRAPNLTELGIFSVWWPEHCSYNSSRLYLKKLPTSAAWVIQGPGENAGVTIIGKGPSGTRL